MTKNIISQIIEDLKDIHDVVPNINDIDERIIKSISAVQNSRMELNALEPLRLELWSTYTDNIITKIEKLLKDLSSALVPVKPFRIKLEKTKKLYKKIKDRLEFQTLPTQIKDVDEIKLCFNDMTELWNEIVINEDELRSDGLVKFLRGIYLPFAGFITVAYWYFVPTAFVSTPEQNILWFLVILFALYFILRHIIQNPPKMRTNPPIERTNSPKENIEIEESICMQKVPQVQQNPIFVSL